MNISIKDRGQLTGAISGSQYKVSEQKKAQDEAVKQSDISYTSVSSHGDTVTVSKAGKAANSNMGNQDRADGTVTKKNVGEYLTESESSESSNSTINLSGYTEIELKQMYLDGDITKAEYDEELDSRETSN